MRRREALQRADADLAARRGAIERLREREDPEYRRIKRLYLRGEVDRSALERTLTHEQWWEARCERLQSAR